MLMKFKVFDKQLKIVRNVKNISIQNKEVLFYADEFEVNKDEELLDIVRGFDEVVLMMATGLKDKDGCDIYEGDICYWRRDEFEGIIIVKYSMPGLRWLADSNPGEDDLEDFKDDYLKVLGNIYEFK